MSSGGCGGCRRAVPGSGPTAARARTFPHGEGKPPAGRLRTCTEAGSGTGVGGHGGVGGRASVAYGIGVLSGGVGRSRYVTRSGSTKAVPL